MTATEIERLVVRITADGSMYFSTMNRVVRTAESTAMRLESAGRRMALAITLPLAAAGRAAVRQFAAFDQQVTEAFARIGDLDARMRAVAERQIVGLATSGRVAFTPAQLAQGFENLAAAGLGAERALRVLPTVADLAQAGAMDFDETVRHMIGSLTAMGLAGQHVAPEQLEANMRRLSDSVVGVANATDASVSGLLTSLTTDAASVVELFGGELEDVVAALGAYAQAGKHAEVSGNMLARGQRLLGAAFIRNRALWEQYNIDLTDGFGNWAPYLEQVRRLDQGLQGLGEVERAAAMQMLGLATLSQKAITPLFAQIGETNRYRTASRQMGTTAESSAIQMTSFNNQLQVLWNRVRAAGIEIGRALAPALLYLNGRVASAADWFRALDPWVQKVVLGVLALAAAVGPVLIALGVGSSLFLTLTASVSAATTSVTAFTAAWVASPLGLLVGAGALAVYGLAQIPRAIDSAVNSLYGLNEQMEQFVRLSNQGAQILADNLAGTMAEAAGIADPNRRRAFLRERSAEAVGTRDTLRSTADRLRQERDSRGVMGGVWRYLWPTWARQQDLPLESAEQQLAVAEEAVATLNAALSRLGRPSGQVTRDLMDETDVEDLHDEIRKFTEELQLQADTLGMTADQARLYALRLRSATDAELAAAEVQADRNRRLQEYNDLMDEGRRVTEQVRTPQQVYTDRVARLNELMRMGALPSQDVYNRALAQAAEEFDQDANSADRLRQAIENLAQVEATAAYGSAEAISRLQAQRDRFRGLPDRFGRAALPPTPAPPPAANPYSAAPPGNAAADFAARQAAGQQLQVLQEIAGFVGQMAAGQPIQFVPAGGP